MSIRVLIVDDSAADAELIRREVRGVFPDADCRWAGTAQALEAALRELTPDAVISDHNMVAFTGRDALALVKRQAPHVPFLLVTGSLDEETAVEYMKAGATDYLLKDRMARLGPALQLAIAHAERRRALRREQDLLREVLDAAPSVIFVKDEEGRFVLGNKAMADLYGLASPAELVGRASDELNAHPEQVERLKQFDAEVRETGARKFVAEESLTDVRTGELRWFQTIRVPLRLRDGGGTLVLGVATDVTDRRALEQQFRQAQKMEAIGRLAGGVAHDFNNVLTSILGYAQLLRDTFAESDDRLADIQEILASAERAAGLTRQLLAFSRKQVLQPRLLSLNDVVGGMGAMLHRLIGEDIELKLALAPDVQAVLADRGQMEQVILNLAVNARDAMPNGGKITIETANVELDAAFGASHMVDAARGDYVLLAVSDTGVGMDQTTKNRLFEPFFTTKGSAKGTGLGLSTVYGIVKQSDGYIWVYSEPGQGTTFKIYLPRKEGAPEAEAQAMPGSVLGGSETVLVVEDEDSVRALARRLLEEYGYTVIDGARESDALRAIEDHGSPPDLLLTDVVLPGSSGRELARHLQDRYPELRVLYMSGYTDDAVVHHGVLDPGVEFVQKPFTPEVLGRRVRAALDRAR